MIIINANIITMDKTDYKNGFIITEGAKISALGDMSDFNSSEHRGEDIIDASGCIVTPGFIDAHCHIGMWGDGVGFESADGNEEVEPITPHLRAIDAVNALDYCFSEAAAAGVTTVLTGPGSANPIAGQWLAMKTVGKRIDDMTFAEPVGMKFALGENPKTVYHDKEQTPVTRMAIAALIRKQLLKAQRYMEDLEQYAEDEDADDPEYDMKSAALIPVLRRKEKAFFHCHRADDIFTAIRISKEFNLDYVLVHCTEGYKIADELKAENAKIITGPIICDRSKPELKEQTPENTAKLVESGLTVAICTDHPVIPIQYLPLSAAVARKHGLANTDALKAITINAAEIVGIDSRVGSLTVGKDADIVITDGDPLDLNSTVKHVIINGNRVL